MHDIFHGRIVGKLPVSNCLPSYMLLIKTKFVGTRQAIAIPLFFGGKREGGKTFLRCTNFIFSLYRNMYFKIEDNPSMQSFKGRNMYFNCFCILFPMLKKSRIHTKRFITVFLIAFLTSACFDNQWNIWKFCATLLI